MNFEYIFSLASAAEAWQSVPLMSLHLPFFGQISTVNNWLLTVLLAVQIQRGNHSLNHSSAQAGNSALTGLRKMVIGFWNTQTLERVHLKWRRESLRSFFQKENTEISNHSSEILTNRQPAAWRSLSEKRGKTTVVWLSALFFLQLVRNSFGQVPLFSGIPGRAGFTLGLSIALLSAITYLGIRRQGVRFVRLFLPSGPSWPMAPLFILQESISYAFRAISQGTRLYCNLFAGHQLLHLFTSLSQVPVVACPFQQGAPLTAIAACILMALSALETIVAVLQSGVFCLLTSFYLHEVLRRKDNQAFAISFFFLYFL